jgi:hypothetical protein
MDINIPFLIGQAISAFLAVFIVQVGVWIWKDVLGK